MATYASLLTLKRNIQDQIRDDRNIQDQIRDDPNLETLRKTVVELQGIMKTVVELQGIMDKCSQATLGEDFEIRIRHYAYEASNVIEVRFLQLMHRIRDEEERCFRTIVYFFDGIRTWMHSRCMDHKLRKLIDEGARLVVEAKKLTDAVTNHPTMTTNMQLKESSSSSSSSSSVRTREGAEKQVPLYLNSEKLEYWLYKVEQRQRTVIPIVGMGGSGKTTLANYLFEGSRTRKHFDCQSWIAVSENYDIETVFSQILLDLKESIPQNCEDEKRSNVLGKAVYQALIKRRYLIVIDNVWSKVLWDDIKIYLPDDAKASRVLLTTRDGLVAAYWVTSTSESYIHNVKELDEDQSLTLLKEKVFGKDKDCPDELENSGKSIAKGCGGLPLSIVVIAGVLSDTRNKESWENVADDVSNAIQIGSDGKVEQILRLSYTNLPHNLKPCFLYLACFPEGYKIEVSKLIMLWVAERFLELEPPERSPEEVAYECLDDLVKKNLVLVSKKNDDGKIELCYLHEQIRSMCVEMAKKENFVCRIEGDGILSSEEMENKIRFSIYSKDFVTDYQHRDKQILRSTHYFPDSCQVPLMSCMHLQVLDAGGILFPEFPEQVCQLHLLKYLALRIKEDFEVSVVEVPPCIIKLRNLQVFRVGFEGLKIELPMEIWEMSKLRHLTFFGESKAFIPDPPAGTTSSSLKNLQTMCSLVDFKFTEEVLRRIPEVKELDIEYNDEEDRYCLRDLDQLKSLETLTIRSGIPSQNIKLPHKLKHLTLSWCGFPWSEIGEVVGSLPNLEVMKLKDNACVGDEWEVKGGEFPKLKVLEIEETDLIFWKSDDEDAESFPRLQRLTLNKCGKLKELPSRIGDIETLTLLKVDKTLENWAKTVQFEQMRYGNKNLELHIEENNDIGANEIHCCPSTTPP